MITSTTKKHNIKIFFFLVYDDSQMRIYAGATITIVIILVLIIFGTVFFFRTKNHDELEKKATNHLPLSMDYTSNEGKA